jgi:UDP-3-O-[3-hydroxymyristoyl] glucosamine N-acyltransferase
LAYTLGELAKLVEGRVVGDEQHSVEGVATLQSATAQHITFLTNPKYKSQLVNTRAGAVILSEQFAAACPVNAIVVDNPHAAYARIAGRLHPRKRHEPAIDSTAQVDDSATLPSRITIGPYAVIGANAVLGEGCYIGPHCVIGDGTQVGEDCELVASVTICDGVIVGKRALLHPGVVIGADGFGQAFDQGEWVKVPQVGTVRIGDDVEIGANTTVDRGAVEDTVIEDGVKLDNQIQIGHNVRVGAHTVIAACTAIAGSVRIGRQCMIGGAVAINGHIEIADGVTITGMSMVSKSLTEPDSYSSGMPAERSADWRRRFVRFRQLEQLIHRVEELERKTNEKDKGA